MRFFVTGGAGFIGSALCRKLVSDGDDVLNVDALTYAANLTSLHDIDQSVNYRFEKADITDAERMRELMTSFRPDAVVHLAAESHVDRSITGSAAFVQTNVVGTHVLLDAARAYHEALPSAERDWFRFVHVSTDEVFGSLGSEGTFDEQTRYDPRSPYSSTKAASDHLARAWLHTYGLPVVVTNCSNNYGPYHFPEKLIPLMILNALEGKPLPVYGDGRQVRDWLYVDDHAAGLALAATDGVAGQTYCIGGASERENLTVVELICDLVDEMSPSAQIGARRSLISFVADRPGHDRRYAIDSSKIETELGWTRTVTFEEGLRRTVAWYLARKDWWEPIRASKYTGERLGLTESEKA